MNWGVSHSASRASRIRGCLLGGAVGDALGAGIEFQSIDQIRQRYGRLGVTGFTAAYGQPNAITDDTQLTLFTVEALLGGDDVELVDRLWARYRAWACYQDWGAATSEPSQPVSPLERDPAMTAIRAPGNACLSGLRSGRRGTVDAPANRQSKGCGAVMRAAPFGLAADSPEQAWSEAIAGSVLTHGHPSGVLSSAAFAWIIRSLVAAMPLVDAVATAMARLEQEGDPGAECLRALRQGVELAAAGAPTPERLELLGGGWTGEEALAIAVFAALSEPSHLESTGSDSRDVLGSALLVAVNHSGDSDSTGAICGNLLGAALGVEAIPVEWGSEVEAASLVLDYADQLSARFPA
ncbi:ADP-ribosylglycohydrolase [Frankineae bacterium MT45]|nr:ADP-ribosylglycohydrolase [Frankineae bacterium MT45]